MGIQKNVASQKFRVFAFDATTNLPVTGDAANITCKIGIDWAALAAVADTNPTETEDGYYLFDLTQAETNGNVLDFYPDSSTANVVVIAVPGTVYTIPPSFQSLTVAAIQSGLATPTNITAGTITTVTNLTNLPSIPNNWLTAAGIAAAALNGKGDWNIGKTGYSLTQSFPTNFAALGINASGHVERVTLVDTTTANTDMRGTDSAATAAALATAQTAIDALPTAAENATAILAAGDVDGFTLEETLKLCLAALAGKLSGAATAEITIRSADDTADRVVAAVDADGNRTAVTLDATG